MRVKSTFVQFDVRENISHLSVIKIFEHIFSSDISNIFRFYGLNIELS